MSELACGVGNVPTVAAPSISLAETRRSVVAAPSATLKVTPETAALPSMTEPTPEIVDPVSPTAVTVPLSAKAACPVGIAVEVSVPPLRVTPARALKKAPLFVTVPPALITKGVACTTVWAPKTLPAPKV